MSKFFLPPGNPTGITQGSLVLEKQDWRLQRAQWQLVQTWTGSPADVAYHRANWATLYPNAIDVQSVEDSQTFWQFVVIYGSTDPAETVLNSTWTIDGNDEELRISAHPLAVDLDISSPGWTRFIEYKIDLHYQTNPERKFDYATIQSAQLLSSSGGAHTPIHSNYTVTQLDALAQLYAEAWEQSVEAYLDPRWVIRNTIEVSAAFNYATAYVLFANINRMFTNNQLYTEVLQSSDSIPAGTIAPGVLYWMKKPFQKVQTAKNKFIINREYVGLNYFNPFLYSAASF